MKKPNELECMTLLLSLLTSCIFISFSDLAANVLPTANSSRWSEPNPININQTIINLSTSTSLNFTYTLTSRMNVKVAIAPSPSADYDLYVKWDGNLPTEQDYDCAPMAGLGTMEQCAIRNLPPRKYYFVVKHKDGIGTFNATLTGSLSLPVHNTDTGSNYETIQEAIDANETFDGHTIFVEEGTYYENVFVNKTISLIGANRTTTIVDGCRGETAIYVKANNVVINGFTVQNGYSGIWLFYSQGCTISETNAKNNTYGMKLYHSSNSTIRKSIINKNNWFGIKLDYSGKCTLRDNIFVDNNFNFGVDGATLHDFNNDIDTSNTVDGKPIYYLLNQKNLIIDPSTFPEIGYIAFVNSTNITVKNVTLTHNIQGILFAYASNSTISNTIMADNWNGIYLKSCSNCNITRNKAKNNYDYGIALRISRNCMINTNNVTNNGWGGISLGASHNCTVSGNNIANSYYGIHLVDSISCTTTGNNVNKINGGYSIVIYRSYANLIFHNNFINHFIYASGRSDNVWDNKIEGNHWNEYNGTDLYCGPYQNEAGSDGIGDTPYFIDENNQDNYPLMGMFSDFSATPEDHVQTICNSTISDFQFNGTAISFNVSGVNGIAGFCRVCVPTALFDQTYKVFVNGTEVANTVLPCSNETYTYLYFAYVHSTQEVVIISEFPSVSILLLSIIVTLLVTIIARARSQIYKEDF